LEVFNWQHVSDNQDTLSGACDENIGSYVMAPITDPKMIAGPLSIQSWESYSVDPFSGITTMTYTSGIFTNRKTLFYFTMGRLFELLRKYIQDQQWRVL
jgi:hypothetical protein